MATSTRPQTHGPRSTIESLTALRRKEAEREHVAFAQYAGHWDGWVLVEVTHDVTTKMGPAFRAGDLVIARPEGDPLDQEDQGQFRTCYSYRNGIDTAVPRALVRAVLITN